MTIEFISAVTLRYINKIGNAEEAEQVTVQTYYKHENRLELRHHEHVSSHCKMHKHVCTASFQPTNHRCEVHAHASGEDTVYTFTCPCAVLAAAQVEEKIRTTALPRD